VFYLKYDIYRNAWPLLALATYRKICQRASPVDGQPHPSMDNSPDSIRAKD
jgi:hypothetical protein